MKRIVFLFCVFILFAFSISDKNEKAKNLLKNIKDLKSAEEFEKKHKKKYFAQLIYLRTERDSSILEKELLNLLNQEIAGPFPSKISDREVYYKVIATDSTTVSRVSYIYLDGKIYNTSQIDSLRNLILKKINEGESFFDLAKKYSMDGNNEKGGDIGWVSDGMLVKPFQEAAKNHNKNDVYIVDVPEYKWYYVCKKTDDSKKGKKSTLIRIEL